MNIYDIKQPKDIKECSIAQLQDLAQQIRVFLIQSIAKTGGHLSSNLGVVELTLAMHYVFDSPTDKFIFDVGHQSYVHKILTGREISSQVCDSIRESPVFRSARKASTMSGRQDIPPPRCLRHWAWR